MKKLVATLLMCLVLVSTNAAYAGGTHGTNGEVTGRSVGAGLISFFIWPGIGQAINDNSNEDKAITHALLGLTGIFRIWSGYDALVDRKGGVWKNRI